MGVCTPTFAEAWARLGGMNGAQVHQYSRTSWTEHLLLAVGAPIEMAFHDFASVVALQVAQPVGSGLTARSRLDMNRISPLEDSDG